MRFKEFYTSESIDRFMSGILGKSASISDVIDKISSDDKTSSDDKDTTDSDKNTPNIDKKTVKSSGSEIMPVNAPVSSKFGFRTSVGKAHNHNGTDFAVPIGTPVKAPQSGIIVGAGDAKGTGTFVILDSNGTIHKFFHLSKIKVSQGQKVNQGDVIALTGNTGYSTGPHLHWEKHIAGRPVDPMANVG